MKEHSFQLIKELSQLYGPSSYEDRVREYVKEKLEPLSDEVVFDRLGSTIAIKRSKNPDAPSIMFLAHMDEVGFMVTSVEEDGLLSFSPLGGWWPQTMMSQRVMVHGKQDCLGVITSRVNRQTMAKDQLNKALSIDAMRIDCGFSNKKEALAWGVIPGTFATPVGDVCEMAGGKRMLGKAFDDRAGVAAVIELMEHIKDLSLDCNIYAGGSCEEEGGNKSAKSIVAKLKPDIFIAVDCSQARDVHGKNETSRLGDGFLLRFLDGRMRPNYRLRNLMQQIAEDNNIRYQLFNSYGGTDAAAVQNENEGVITGVIGIPVRYSHTHAVMMEKSDYDDAVSMLVAMAKTMNPALFQRIISY